MWMTLVLGQALMASVTLAQGTASGIEAPRQVVTRSAADWAALWMAPGPGATPPAVAFSRTMVVGVFLGLRPTAGFSAQIARVRTEGPRTIVEYMEQKPAAGVMLAQVLTFPFHLITVPATPGPVDFREVQP